MRRFEYHHAQTLEQASRLLTDLGDDTFLFNGGTDLLVEIRERLRRVRHVVDIKRIPGLSDITYDETRGLTFGALVTVGRLERLSLVRELYPNLRAALASLGSIQVRNRATVVIPGRSAYVVPVASLMTGPHVCRSALVWWASF